MLLDILLDVLSVFQECAVDLEPGVHRSRLGEGAFVFVEVLFGKEGRVIRLRERRLD